MAIGAVNRRLPGEPAGPIRADHGAIRKETRLMSKPPQQLALQSRVGHIEITVIQSARLVPPRLKDRMKGGIKPRRIRIDQNGSRRIWTRGIFNTKILGIKRDRGRVELLSLVASVGVDPQRRVDRAVAAGHHGFAGAERCEERLADVVVESVAVTAEADFVDVGLAPLIDRLKGRGDDSALDR